MNASHHRLEHLPPVTAIVSACAIAILLPTTALAQAPSASLPPPQPTSAASPASVVALGTVAPFFSTDLFAKDTGFVSDVSADIGDHVKKGQVLAKIDDPELAQQVVAAEAGTAARRQQAAAAEAAVLQARAALEVARHQLLSLEAEDRLMHVTLERQEQLFAANGATQQQMDEVRARAEIAHAALGTASARIVGAEADLQTAHAARSVADAQIVVADAEAQRVRSLLQYTQIVSPFDGVITHRAVSPGDLAQASSASHNSSMFTCQKIDVVRVTCDVPESAVASVRPGTPAEVRLLGIGGKPLTGTVTRISIALDPTTRTMRAEIDLPNPDEHLHPGMYAQVTLTLQPPAQPAAAQ